MSTEPVQLKDDSGRLRQSFLLAAMFTLILWLIKFSEVIFKLDLVGYGVYPLRPDGLTGIILAPLIHSSFAHLFANTAPLIILGTVILYGYPRSAKIVLPSVYLGTGMGVWLFGRQAFHIGASGLTFGVMFFILSIGILRWDRRAIVLSMIVFFLYGSMIWGIFPMDPSVSFESHLAGAVIGITLAILLRNHDPLPPSKTYSWEEQTEDTDETDGR